MIRRATRVPKPGVPLARRLATGLAVLCTTALAAPAAADAQAPAPPPREPFVEIPEGCPIQQLADVVFVGSVEATDYRTVRYRIDQLRAGDLGRFASEVDGEFLVDVRYGVDTKYLEEGEQYLVGASVPAGSQSGLLESKVAERLSPLGGDEIIGANEIELQCPEVDDPNLTLQTDGTPIDSGLLTPLFDDSGGLLRAVLVAAGLVIGGLFALAALRWVLTGFGRGMESLARTSGQSREARSAIRAREALPAGTARSRGAGVPPARPRRR